MMQQQMMQQQSIQNNKSSKNNNKNLSILYKIKGSFNNQTLQEIFLISILFIILSTSFFKNNLSKIPFVTNENNCLNTAGLLISAVLIALLFVIIRLFL
jgi:hypothetical protein